MAFTSGEFARGALAAWFGFLVLLSVSLIALTLAGDTSHVPFPGILLAIVLIVAIVGGVFATFVAALFAPLAWFIGRLLRRTRRAMWHVLAYAGLGLVVGVSVVWGYVAITFWGAADPSTLVEPFSLVVIGASSAAVPLGWLWTYGIGLRREAAQRSGRRTVSPIDTEKGPLAGRGGRLHPSESEPTASRGAP